MSVLRITANIETDDPTALAAFYQRAFGLDLVMDLGFVTTLQAKTEAPVQLSTASEGGSGTPVPRLSIDVDDLDETINRLHQMGHVPEYGPIDEPWGVRRFYVRDPAGTLLNILCHTPQSKNA